MTSSFSSVEILINEIPYITLSEYVQTFLWPAPCCP